MDGLLPVKNQLDGLQKRVREIDRAIKEVLDSDEDMTRMHLTGTRMHLTPSALSSHHKQYSKTMRTIAHRHFHPTLHSHTLNSPVVKTASTQKKQQLQEEDDEQVLSATLSEQPLLHTPLYSTSTDSDKMNLEMLLETYLHQISWVGSEIDSHLDQILNTEQNVALQMDLLRNRILRFELTLSLSSFIISCGALVTGMFGMNLLSHLELHRGMFWLVSVVLVVGMVTSYGQFRQYGKSEGLF